MSRAPGLSGYSAAPELAVQARRERRCVAGLGAARRNVLFSCRCCREFGWLGGLKGNGGAFAAQTAKVGVITGDHRDRRDTSSRLTQAGRTRMNNEPRPTVATSARTRRTVPRQHMLAVPVLIAVLAGSAVGVNATDDTDPDDTELDGLVTEEVEPGVERIISDDAGHDLDETHPTYRYDMDDVAVTPDGTVWLCDHLQPLRQRRQPPGRAPLGARAARDVRSARLLCPALDRRGPRRDLRRPCYGGTRPPTSRARPSTRSRSHRTAPSGPWEATTATTVACTASLPTDGVRRHHGYHVAELIAITESV